MRSNLERNVLKGRDLLLLAEASHYNMICIHVSMMSINIDSGFHKHDGNNLPTGYNSSQQQNGTSIAIFSFQPYCYFRRLNWIIHWGFQDAPNWARFVEKCHGDGRRIIISHLTLKLPGVGFNVNLVPRNLRASCDHALAIHDEILAASDHEHECELD